MVRRYDETGLMEEAREGFYVLYTDYAALEAEKARLKEALEASAKDAQDWLEWWTKGARRGIIPSAPSDDIKMLRDKARAALGEVPK